MNAISAPNGRTGKLIASIIGIVVLVVVVNLAVRAVWPNANGTPGKVETRWEQIKKRGSIRCGWVSNPPSCMKDPNTGKLSGIVVEVMAEIGKKWDLKIDWVEEAGFGSMIEGINADRYDMVPSAIWPNSARAKQADFSAPLFYSGIGVYVRPDDNRFNNDIKLINSENVKIATMDGEMAEVIAKTDFPNAKTVQVPQLSEITTMLLNVKDGKADVGLVELYFAQQFLKNNPGTLKNIVPNRPIRVFPDTIMIKANEFDLKSALNTAIEELINVGVVDGLIEKYEPAPGTFYRLKTPYRMSGD